MKIKSFTFTNYVLFLILWLSIFSLCLIKLTDLKIPYLVFSLISLSALLLSFYQKYSYTYLYISIFLWLGIWLKFSIHSIIDYSFIEPVGDFQGGVQSWEDVLYISSTAYSALLFAGILLFLLCRHLGYRETFKVNPPSWYLPVRKRLWLVLLFALPIIASVNLLLGIHHIGLSPHTVLIWPLNALITWFLNIGLITAFLTLIWWDNIIFSKIGVTPILAIITEALITSVSIFSRALYIFHVIPSLLALYLNRKESPISLTPMNLATLILVIALSFFLSISMVTTLRNYYYQANNDYKSTFLAFKIVEMKTLEDKIARLEWDIKNATNNEVATGIFKQVTELSYALREIKKEVDTERAKINAVSGKKNLIIINEFQYQIKSGFFERLLFLSVDRWIGLEGIMASQAFTQKSVDLLVQAASGFRGANELDIFQGVSKSIYEKADRSIYNFRSLPGIVGFLYLSGSYVIIFLGVIFMVLLAVCLEIAIAYSTRNPLLVSLYSAEFANTIAQFGGSPLQTVRYLCILLIGIGFIWFINSKYFIRLLQILRIHKESSIDVSE